MSSFLPRKYNNYVVIGLAASTIFLAFIILLMMTKTINLQPSAKIQPPSPSPRVELRASTNLSKPALVLFYADQCGWCQKMLPAWEKVKQSLNETNQLEVLDFEITRDPEDSKRGMSLPGFRGYPDVRFYPDGYPSGSPVMYEGDRSEESLLKFAYTGKN